MCVAFGNSNTLFAQENDQISEELVDEAEEMYEVGDIKEAVLLFKEILSIDPENIDARKYLKDIVLNEEYFVVSETQGVSNTLQDSARATASAYLEGMDGVEYVEEFEENSPRAVIAEYLSEDVLVTDELESAGLEERIDLYNSKLSNIKEKLDALDSSDEPSADNKESALEDLVQVYKQRLSRLNDNLDAQESVLSELNYSGDIEKVQEALPVADVVVKEVIVSPKVCLVDDNDKKEKVCVASKQNFGPRTTPAKKKDVFCIVRKPCKPKEPRSPRTPRTPKVKTFADDLEKASYLLSRKDTKNTKKKVVAKADVITKSSPVVRKLLVPRKKAVSESFAYSLKPKRKCLWVNAVSVSDLKKKYVSINIAKSGSQQVVNVGDTYVSDEDISLLSRQILIMEDLIRDRNEEILDLKDKLVSMEQYIMNSQLEEGSRGHIDLIKQKDLEIDMLKQSLVEAQNRLMLFQGKVPQSPRNDDIEVLKGDVAAAELKLFEQGALLESRDQDIAELKAGFVEVSERLKLLQKIIEEKNSQIEELEDSLRDAQKS